MATAWWAGGIAFGVHAALFIAMASIPKNAFHESTVVTMASQKKAKKDDSKKDLDDKPPEPPKPIKAPPRALARPAAAEPPPPAQNTPPPPVNTPAANAALAAMPDFGLSLAGGSGPGIAVPTGGSGPNTQAAAAKTAAPAARAPSAPKPTEGDCTEDVVKAKPLGTVQPQYTEDARAAGVEGKVRVSISVDATGAVTDVHVLSGLGHGLDQAAVSAAKRMKFSAATRCGKAADSTVTVTMRFVLGD